MVLSEGLGWGPYVAGRVSYAVRRARMAVIGRRDTGFLSMLRRPPEAIICMDKDRSVFCRALAHSGVVLWQPLQLLEGEGVAGWVPRR